MKQKLRSHKTLLAKSSWQLSQKSKNSTMPLWRGSTSSTTIQLTTTNFSLTMRWILQFQSLTSLCHLLVPYYGAITWRCWLVATLEITPPHPHGHTRGSTPLVLQARTMLLPPLLQFMSTLCLAFAWLPLAPAGRRPTSRALLSVTTTLEHRKPSNSWTLSNTACTRFLVSIAICFLIFNFQEIYG